MHDSFEAKVPSVWPYSWGDLSYCPPYPPSPPSSPPPSPPSPHFPPPPPSPPPIPPAPIESHLLSSNTFCSSHFDLATHGGASGFDEASCLQAAFAALHPATEACFALYAATGACYVCQACAPTEARSGMTLYKATWLGSTLCGKIALARWQVQYTKMH